MIVYFDYIFFRVAKRYFKRDGSGAYTALLLVSSTQSIWLFVLIGWIIAIFDATSKVKEIADRVPFVGSGIAIAILILILNHFRYKDKYWTFSALWRDSGTEVGRYWKGWLVVLSLLLPYIALIILFVIFGKYTR